MIIATSMEVRKTMQLYEHSGAVTISGLILASLVGVVTQQFMEMR
jgi:hypothetical protein